MEVLVCCMCQCCVPAWSCPNCKGKGTITRWIPVEALPVLRMPYYILSRRFVTTDTFQPVAS